MRLILRKIAENDFGSLGDTSTLADPRIFDQHRKPQASLIRALWRSLLEVFVRSFTGRQQIKVSSGFIFNLFAQSYQQQVYSASR